MIPTLESCKPGLRPMGYSILVAVDAVEEKTAGGILLPTKHTERETSAAEKGLIVDISDMAFQGGDWDGAYRPDKGDTVVFQRYAGSEYEGADGKQYRIIEDKDLRGVLQ